MRGQGGDRAVTDGRESMASSDTGSNGVTAEDTEGGHSVHPALHIAAPLVALAATWAVRTALNAGYRAVTKSAPPSAEDARIPLRKALAWTLVTTTSAALVELFIMRAANRRTGGA